MENDEVKISKRVTLDEAAYYCLYGAKIISIGGNPYNSVFRLELSKKILETIKAQPLVNFKEYMNKRKKIKIMGYKAVGHPRESFNKRHLYLGGKFKGTKHEKAAE